MPGPNDLTIDERLTKINDALNDFEKSIGLGDIQLPQGVDKYINLSQGEISKLTSDELAEGAYLLERLGLYVTQEQNKLKSVVVWVEGKLPLEIADDAKQCGDRYAKYEERSILAIKQNSAATRLYQIKNQYNQKLERLNYTAQRLNAMSRILVTLLNQRCRDG